MNSYEKAILISGEDKITVTKIAIETEKEAIYTGCYKAFAIAAGPCTYISGDKIENIFENLEHTRPLMEGVSIDVFRTARNNGFRIETPNNQEAKHQYFSLVLTE